MAINRVGFKSGFASIIGLPNSGKSTFLNAVIKEKIAITSKKPQTTRKNLKGIYNDETSQIIFVDTPGIYRGKTKLDEYMSKSVRAAMDSIDVVIIIVDINTYKDDDYTKIISVVKNIDAQKILLINKIDVYKNEVDEAKNEIIGKFDKSSLRFDSVICISALKKKNILDVINVIKKHMPAGERYYDDTYLTDEPVKKIISDMVRQQCLYKLDKEVPHSLEVVVTSMKKSKSKCMNIYADIICDRDAQKKIIIGRSGLMIKNIGTGARIAIEKFIGSKVNLKLNVIVKENWRDEKTILMNFGYDINNI